MVAGDFFVSRRTAAQHWSVRYVNMDRLKAWKPSVSFVGWIQYIDVMNDCILYQVIFSDKSWRHLDLNIWSLKMKLRVQRRVAEPDQSPEIYRKPMRSKDECVTKEKIDLLIFYYAATALIYYIFTWPVFSPEGPCLFWTCFEFQMWWKKDQVATRTYRNILQINLQKQLSRFKPQNHPPNKSKATAGHIAGSVVDFIGLRTPCWTPGFSHFCDPFSSRGQWIFQSKPAFVRGGAPIDSYRGLWLWWHTFKKSPFWKQDAKRCKSRETPWEIHEQWYDKSSFQRCSTYCSYGYPYCSLSWPVGSIHSFSTDKPCISKTLKIAEHLDTYDIPLTFPQYIMANVCTGLSRFIYIYIYEGRCESVELTIL